MAVSKATQDEIRDRLTLSDVIGQRVKLKRAGKEYMGLCPFHGEKTPSFTVNNQKGFFHCFGCGAHGDVFGFLMQDENLSFPEALEKAADMAGVKIEKSREFQGPSKAQMEYRERLFQLMRRACDYFQNALTQHEGKEAARYISARLLTSDTVKKFFLGYAPEQRQGLLTYLEKQGFTLEEMRATGVLSENEETGKRFDKFRGRLIFPITNPKGQIVGFGGRALKKDQTPKYLNSPETQLFHKGAQVYNYDKAAKSKDRELPLLIVEGYMDVIKLAQSGYERVVASLGTALTEGQIQQCWKLDLNPVVLMDGDAAGVRAQKRVIERVLPLITPNKTLSFLTLPEGLDPDAYVDAKGVQKFKALLETKKSLVDQLWDLFYVSLPRNTPEEKSQAEKNLKSLVSSVTDPTLKQYYIQEIKDRLYQVAYQSKILPKTDGKWAKKQETKKRKPVAFQDLTVQIFVLLMVRYPKLVEAFEEEIASVSLSGPYQALQEECLRLCAAGVLDSKKWQEQLMGQDIFRRVSAIR